MYQYKGLQLKGISFQLSWLSSLLYAATGPIGWINEVII